MSARRCVCVRARVARIRVTRSIVHTRTCLNRDPVDLGDWDEEKVKELVEAFLHVRFPTILLLNKADQVSGGGYVNANKGSTG